MSKSKKVMTQEEIDEAQSKIKRAESEIHSFYENMEQQNPNDEDQGCIENTEQYYIDSLGTECSNYKRLLNENEYNVLFNKYNTEYGFVEQGQYLGDTNDSDLLNRKEKAKLIANMLVYDSPTSHFNIGILGKWGSGKSTLLNLIENELDDIDKLGDSTNKTKVHLVKIDASEYEETYKIWYNILKQVFKKYEKDKKWYGIILYKLKTISKFTMAIRAFAFVVMLAGLVLLDNSVVIGSQSAVNSIFGAGIGALSVAVGIISAVIPLIKEVSNLSLPLSNSIASFIELPNFDSDLGDRESVKTHLNNIIKVWIGKKNEKVVLFVDEIDRCSKTGVIEFFKSIQILTNVPNINVVYSINQEYLSKVLAENGHETQEEKRRFLDKYMSFSIMLNTKNQTGEYIKNLVEKSSFSTIEKDMIYKIFRNLNRYDVTPREMKKIVNILILSKQYAKIYAIKNNVTIVFDKFIVWFTMAYLFPDDTAALIGKISTSDKFDKLSYYHFSKDETEKIKNILRYNLKSELDDLAIQNLVEFNNLSKEVMTVM